MKLLLDTCFSAGVRKALAEAGYDIVWVGELDGHTAKGALNVRFDTIRSIARRSGDSTLLIVNTPVDAS